jgi:two-component system sensor histidine kinase NreB
LARDLHDVVIQQLIGLSYKFSETRKKLSGESKGEDVRQEVQDDLKSFQEGLIETVSKLRSVMRDLRPVGLDDLGLTEAFEAELTRLQREIDPKGPKIEWDLERTDEPISYLVKINLFRIAQEAVKNAIAHAEAKSIKVVLRFYDDTGTLEIIDDGIGFNVPGRLSQFAQTNHYGLLGIYERASSIDGQLIVESQSNRGTMVSIHFQL